MAGGWAIVTGRKRAETPVLHIHGQEEWHDDAHIVGNRAGLELLRLAIDRALKSGEGYSDAFVADGEEYTVYVHANNEPWQSDVWRLAALPYTDEIARETRPDARWPRGVGA